MPAVPTSFDRFCRRLLATSTSSEAWPNRVVFAHIDSTNAMARRALAAFREAAEAPPRVVFAAWEQRAGRGRGGNRWQSPAGQGLYLTFLLPAVEVGDLPELPRVVAVRLAEALGDLVPRRVGIKWPNDLLVDGRKLGGLLIESMAVPGGRWVDTVIGIGVNHRAGRDDLAVPGATSLRLVGAALESSAEGLAELAGLTIEEVGGTLAAPATWRATAARYPSLSVHRPGERLTCRTSQGAVEGFFRGFDERGFLRLATDEGEVTMPAGELEGLPTAQEAKG